MCIEKGIASPARSGRFIKLNGNDILLFLSSMPRSRFCTFYSPRLVGCFHANFDRAETWSARSRELS